MVRKKTNKPKTAKVADGWVGVVLQITELQFNIISHLCSYEPFNRTDGQLEMADIGSDE